MASLQLSSTGDHGVVVYRWTSLAARRLRRRHRRRRARHACRVRVPQLCGNSSVSAPI